MKIAKAEKTQPFDIHPEGAAPLDFHLENSFNHMLQFPKRHRHPPSLCFRYPQVTHKIQKYKEEFFKPVAESDLPTI